MLQSRITFTANRHAFAYSRMSGLRKRVRLGQRFLGCEVAQDVSVAPSTPAAPAPQFMFDERKNLLSFTYEELQEEMTKLSQPKYRTTQLFSHVYKRGLTDFSAMTDIGKQDRVKLADKFTIHYGTVQRRDESADGTNKWLVGVRKGQAIETVYIPMGDDPEFNTFTGEVAGDGEAASSSNRGAVCDAHCHGASAAAWRWGWPLMGFIGHITFCHTGTMPKKDLRNLGAEEIIGQLMTAKRDLVDWDALNLKQPLAPNSRAVSNIVMMGMGEPLYNYRNVRRALEIMTDGRGLGYGKRRVTLSTSGVAPGIDKLANDMPVCLAVSLHAVTDELRNEIVPINKQYPISVLLDACRRYPALRPNRRLTVEYVMLKGVNDSLAEARELVRILKGIPVLINLIPFNPWPGSKYESSSNNAIYKFQEVVLEAAGSGHTHSPYLRCTIRWPRGRDILAACGQLAVKKLQEGGIDASAAAVRALASKEAGVTEPSVVDVPLKRTGPGLVW